MKKRISNNVYKIIAIVSWSIALATVIITVSDHITAKRLNAVEVLNDGAVEPITYSSEAEQYSATEENESVQAGVKEQYNPLAEEENQIVQLEKEITIPDELNDILIKNGITVQQLNDLECSQLITVVATKSSAIIDFYFLKDYAWKSNEDLSCSGYVGSNGVSDDKHEGDYSTPAGIYSISEAFYIYDKPETGLTSFQITGDTFWIDDPDSAYYNKRVEGLAYQDWDSAEHMIDYTDAYEYGFVINYNTSSEYNAGSAIFFHISNKSTSGCVGTDKEYVLSYLKELRSELNPHILITSS